jgi:hypothetical protein
MGLVTALIIGYVVRTVVLLLLLWIMVELQKLNYSIAGLLGSAALASALDMIPFAGHALAVPVLYLCVWKVTRASLFPDAVFTVAVSYALMFLVQMLLLTALTPDLRHHPANDDREQLDPDRSALVETQKLAETVAAQPTNNPARVPSPVSAPTTPTADWLQGIKVTGVAVNGDKSMLFIVAEKKKPYTLVLGEPTAVQTAKGVRHVQLVNASGKAATVEINGETVTLKIP